MHKIVDLHCDTIMALYQNKNLKLKSNDLRLNFFSINSNCVC